MRSIQLSLLAIIIVAPSVPRVAAQADPATPCCAIMNFQTFNPKDVVIQLVSVKRTSANDITVTWQMLNRSKTAQQFERMTGLASYQLSSGAAVLDLATRTKYPVARDEKTSTPVAAKHDPPRASQGLALRAEGTLVTWAKFLVPASVTKVTVTLPGAAMPWENVPIAP